MVYVRQIIIAMISILLVLIPLPIAAEPPLPSLVVVSNKITKKPVVKKIIAKPIVAPVVAPVVIKPAPQPAPKPAPIQPGTCEDWIAKAGILDVSSAIELIGRESGCNPFATNPSSGAYGIPQSLPAGKMASAGADWATNPVTQLIWMKGYVEERYGTFAIALAHSYSNNWY